MMWTILCFCDLNIFWKGTIESKQIYNTAFNIFVLFKNVDSDIWSPYWEFLSVSVQHPLQVELLDLSF